MQSASYYFDFLLSEQYIVYVEQNTGHTHAGTYAHRRKHTHTTHASTRAPRTQPHARAQCTFMRIVFKNNLKPIYVYKQQYICIYKAIYTVVRI